MILAATLAVAAALPYIGALSNGFVYDDGSQILNNPYLRNFHHLRAVLTTTVWSFLGGSAGLTNYYRPLMTLQYLACFQLFGPRASMFHLANILLNVAVVLVLFGLTARWLGNRALAFAAAMMFALHPIHTESVDWIAGVTDLQLTLLYLLAFWFFLKAARPGGELSVTAEIGMALTFVLALASKEPAITFPALATLYEHAFREDRTETRWTEKVARYGVTWVLAAGYFVLRIRLFGSVTPAPPSRPGMSFDEIGLSALALFGEYMRGLLWPVHLSAFHVFSADWVTRLPWAGVGLAASAGLVVLCLLLLKHSRKLAFAGLWVPLTLAPVLDARWMASNALAERYLYLPSVGFCWLVAGLGWWLWTRWRVRAPAWKWGLVGAAGILAALAVGRVVTRNREWRDDITLCRVTLAGSPNAYPILNNLGLDYWKHGDMRRAEREWLKADAASPGTPFVLDNLAVLYMDTKRYDQALIALQQSLDAAPNDDDAHRELGMLYQREGRRDQAERELKVCLALSPLEVRAHNQLGQLYSDEGHWAGASAEFHASLDSRPTVAAYIGLGLLYWRLTEIPQAESNFKAAEALDPSEADPHFMLALLYSSSGRTAEARREYSAGFKIDPNNAPARFQFQKLEAQDDTSRSK